MKKIFIYSLAALALTSCGDDEFLGVSHKDNPKTDGAILFSPSKRAMTKGEHVGADAAALLNNNFVVMGTKGGTIDTPSSVVATKVFDHYNVNWTANTANTTASNTADWEYAGQTVHTYATANGITAQTIKYWDYSAGQYDFIAYSGGTATVITSGTPTAGQLLVTQITPATATNATNGAYMVTGATADLAKFYIADLVTAYNPAYTSAPTAVRMGNEVQLKFRNIASKVRVGLYETVPGYSIKDVEFYASDAANIRYVAASPQPTSGTMENYFKQDGTPYSSSDNYDSNVTYYVPESDVTTTATLYSQSANIYTDGTYTVYYPTVNDATKSDYNKAHVSFAPTKDASDNVTGATTTSTYAALKYTNSKDITGTTVNYLGETSNDATYCETTPAKDYFTVLPNESATALTLRVNYTLVSNDGSQETIKVWGAKAVVPAQYTTWKSNYAYTYLFKISDNTNGQTQGLGLGTVGLVPITFDAVVTDSEDGMQETVTTVATPSITTYMKEAPNVTANDEYPAGTIYVMVQDGATLKGDLNTKGQLYTVTGASAKVPATEANVMDALNIRTSTGTSSPVVITGRNSLVLTEATSDATITAIPGVNGNDITVTAGQAAGFTGATGTYAYVYTVSDAADTEYNTAVVLTAEPSDWNASDNVYYTDFACTNKANITYADGTYYQKLTNNNTTYAVKVIKVQ